MIQTSINILHICSRCISHEIGSWISDKVGELDLEAIQKINQELRAIKIKQGKCIVCNGNFVSENTIENVIKILEEQKVSNKVQEEFKNLFCPLY